MYYAYLGSMELSFFPRGAWNHGALTGSLFIRAPASPSKTIYRVSFPPKTSPEDNWGLMRDNWNMECRGLWRLGGWAVPVLGRARITSGRLSCLSVYIKKAYLSGDATGHIITGMTISERRATISADNRKLEVTMKWRRQSGTVSPKWQRRDVQQNEIRLIRTKPSSSNFTTVIFLS